MASNDPPGPTPGPAGDPEPTDDDPLARLERRLDRASEAAEQLIAEAAARAVPNPAGDERKPPPAGWQIPDPAAERAAGTERATASGSGTGHSSYSSAQGEVDLLLHVLSSLRDRIPPELQRRIGEAVREVLLALRALIDWYLERSDRRRVEPEEVQDIPIL